MSVRRLLAAGVVAGLLPFIHGHTYMVVVGMAGCLALLLRMWPAWIAFVVVAAGLGLPQLLWLAKGSAVDSASFVGWWFGWDRGETGAVVFWLMNTGALIPIIVWALMARGESSAVPARLRRFYLPFLLCFLVPNVVRLAPVDVGQHQGPRVLVSRLHTARVARARTLVSQWELASRARHRALHFADSGGHARSVACVVTRSRSTRF